MSGPFLTRKDSTRQRSRWDLSPPSCLTRRDSTPGGSETVVTSKGATPILGSPSHDIVNENEGGSTLRQYSSYFLQHLIDRCQKISKSDTLSSRNTDTGENKSYLTNWNRKRKRQRIESEQGSIFASSSSDEEIPLTRTRRKIRRISSDSSSCLQKSPESSRLVLRSKLSSVSRSDQHRSRSRSVSRPRQHRSRSRSVSWPRQHRSRSRSINRSRQQRSRSRSVSRSRQQRSRSISKSRQQRSRSRSVSRSRRHRSRSRSVSRSRSRSVSRSRSRSVIRSRSNSVSRPKQQGSRPRTVSRSRSRSRSISQSRQESRRCRSISPSELSSVSGRRSWLKYRYRGPGSSQKSYTRRTISHCFSKKKIHSSSSGVDKELLPFVKAEDIEYFKNLLNPLSNRISKSEQDKRHLIGHLLKIKNGPAAVAKESLKAVQKLARRMDRCVLFNTLLPICMHAPFGDETLRKMAGVIDVIIFRVGRRLSPFIHKILIVVQSLLLEPVIKHQLLAVRVITKLTKIFGLKGMLPVIRNDLNSKDVFVRAISCRSLAVVTSVVGIEKMLPFIRDVCGSEKSTDVCKAGILLIQRTVQLMKEAAQPFLKQLMEVLQTVSRKSRVIAEWTSAVASLAKVAHKEDTPIFSFAWDFLLPRYTVCSNTRKEKALYQMAVFSILHLKSEVTDQDLEDICEAFIRSCSNPDHQLMKCTLQVVHRLSRRTYISDDMYDRKFLHPIIKHFLDRSIVSDEKAKEQFTQVCLRSVRKVGVGKICTYIRHGLMNSDESISKMTAALLAAVLQKYGIRDLSYSAEKEIIVDFSHALNKQVSQDTSIMTSFLSVIKLLGGRLYSHTQDIKQVLIFDKNFCSPQQSKLLQQIKSVIVGAGSGEDGSSGLVMDGCVWNMTETL